MISFKFNPGFLSDEEARANFVVRQDELRQLVALFAGETTRPPRALVVAPRGAGKTTLCKRLLAELPHSPKLAERWHPIFLGEESYTVTTPGEFFLECLFHLKDQLPNAGLEHDYDRALLQEEEEDLLEASLGALRAFSERADKRLLIFVENFHVILADQIGEKGQKLLALLADDALFGVMATSVAQSAIETKKRAPSDYLTLPLDPLTLSECLDLWVALTQQQVTEERIRPLQILTGGSPRLLHILAEFMRTPSLRDLMGNLNRLIDENTEYFKSQLDSLPATERKVFVALLDAWDPSTAKSIAVLARVKPNISSAMLARLTERGAVIQEPGQGRTAIYYAAERLFNIYYLMRRRSDPANRVRALVSFMTEYYDRDELVDTTALLAREACGLAPALRGDYHSTYGAILSKASEAERDRILAQTPPEFIQSFRADQRATRAVPGGSPRSSSKAADFAKAMEEVERAFDAEEFEVALELIKSATKLAPTSAEPWARMSILYRLQNEYDEAIDAAKKAVSLLKTDPWTHAILGQALKESGQLDQAVQSLSRALKLNPEHIVALDALADIRANQGKTSEALDLYERAFGSGPLSDRGCAQFARLLIDEGDRERAETILRKGITDLPDGFEARRQLVDLLDETGRQDEGIEILQKAAESGSNWRRWADYGSFLSARTGHLDEAQRALEKARSLGGETPYVVSRLARTLFLQGRPREEIASLADAMVKENSSEPHALTAAAQIYSQVDAHDKAERAFQSAIEIDETYASKMLFARYLRHRESGLKQAEDLLRDVVASSRGASICGPSKELAEILVQQGREDEARGILRTALRSNEECYCCLVLDGEVCSRKGNKQEAEQRLKAALKLDRDGVAALTALARISDRRQAETLLARAREHSPNDPRVLLAQARLPIGDYEVRIANVRKALEIDATLTEAYLVAAKIESDHGHLDRSMEQLDMALQHVAEQRQFLPAFVDTAMYVARKGNGDEIRRLVESRPEGTLMEPLTVALQLSQGKEPVVAKEVLDVARDIFNNSQYSFYH